MSECVAAISQFHLCCAVRLDGDDDHDDHDDEHAPP